MGAGGMLMYELINARGRSWYVDCPARMGLYQLDKSRVCLIDSGTGKDAAKKVEKILKEKGWSLACIVNTHSHADHIGGNQRLQQSTGCRVFAAGAEAAGTRQPILEPTLLYGGYPPGELRHKFLMAAESRALDISDPDFPEALTPIHLPGHSLNMIGIRTPDDVLYIADSLCSQATLQKYRLCYLYDPGAHFKTLDALEKMEAALFVPSHAPVCEDIRDMVRANRDSLQEILRDILGLLEVPRGFEELLAEVFSLYGLAMTYEQHALVGSTLRSCLAWLWDEGKAEGYLENNRLVFRRT